MGNYSDEPTSFEEVTNAAKLACAHEFILDLPDGYDTVYEGTSVQLSGGQMQVSIKHYCITCFVFSALCRLLNHSVLLQRIAIARALLRDPRILILDEGEHVYALLKLI